MLRATTVCTLSQLPKVVRAWCALYILTWKCASRHNGVHFFDISTSKSGPSMVCFVHFDFQMCFPPQRRALLHHLNFQKWSETVSFFTLLISKFASCHNGVQFFISHLARWLRARRFSEPTFRPSRDTKHWQNTLFRDFSTCSRLHLLSSHSFSSLIFWLLLFSSLPSVHIDGSLTSKLPSTLLLQLSTTTLHCARLHCATLHYTTTTPTITLQLQLQLR